MKLHGNVRTCLRSPFLAVGRVEQKGWTLARVAEAVGVSVRTLSKWLRRFCEEGKPGLRRANCRWPSRLARQREREARLLGDSRPARRSVILNGNEAQQSPGRRFTLAHELGH